MYSVNILLPQTRFDFLYKNTYRKNCIHYLIRRKGNPKFRNRVKKYLQTYFKTASHSFRLKKENTTTFLQIFLLLDESEFIPIIISFLDKYFNKSETSAMNLTGLQGYTFHRTYVDIRTRIYVAYNKFVGCFVCNVESSRVSGHLLSRVDKRAVVPVIRSIGISHHRQ